MKKDVRWLQRLSNLEKAFAELKSACSKKRYTKLERSGLIQTFEYTFELAWKTLQDFLIEKSGYDGVLGPKPVLQRAFRDGLIQKGEDWMEMQASRNMTTHTYEERVAVKIASQIKKEFFPLIEELVLRLQEESESER